MNRGGRSASGSFWGQKKPPTAIMVEFVHEPRIDAVFFCVCVRAVWITVVACACACVLLLTLCLFFVWTVFDAFFCCCVCALCLRACAWGTCCYWHGGKGDIVEHQFIYIYIYWYIYILIYIYIDIFISIFLSHASNTSFICIYINWYRYLYRYFCHMHQLMRLTPARGGSSM
jgi:hypothetical protein